MPKLEYCRRLGDNHGCCHFGSMCRQDISCHGIDICKTHKSLSSMGKDSTYQLWKSVRNASIYVYKYPIINSAWQGSPHWGWVIGNYAIIGSDNGLSLVRCQAIIIIASYGIMKLVNISSGNGLSPPEQHKAITCNNTGQLDPWQETSLKFEPKCKNILIRKCVCTFFLCVFFSGHPVWCQCPSGEKIHPSHKLSWSLWLQYVSRNAG